MRSMIVRSAGSLMLLAVILAIPGLASAAGLTDADYRYLKTEFGLARDSFALRDISAADAAKLHDAISGPLAKEFPQGRIYDTADLLFDVEMRTCQVWQLAMRPPLVRK